MVIQEIIYWFRTHPYPYIRMLLRPSGQTVRMFITKPVDSKKVGDGMWSTTLNLKFPTEIKGYGKVKQVKINHEYPWEQRIIFQPGQAMYLGQVIRHPQTAFIIAYEYPSGSYNIDHANPIPVFYLKEAPRDYFLPPVSIATMQHLGNPTKKNLPLILRLQKTISELRSQLAEARRAALEWHKQAIKKEEATVQQESELKALLESTTDYKAALIQHMLTYREMHQTIENALKHIKGLGFKLTFSKWLAITIISIGVLVFAWTIRDSLGRTGQWLAQPTNMFFALVAVGMACVTLYYIAVKGLKK